MSEDMGTEALRVAVMDLLRYAGERQVSLAQMATVWEDGTDWKGHAERQQVDAYEPVADAAAADLVDQWLRQRDAPVVDADGAAVADPYPQHTRMAAQRPRTEAVHDFWEWIGEHTDLRLTRHYVLQDEGWRAGETVDREVYQVAGEPQFREALARWAGIDLDAAEAEKLAMIALLRAANSRPPLG